MGSDPFFTGELNIWSFIDTTDFLSLFISGLDFRTNLPLSHFIIPAQRPSPIVLFYKNTVQGPGGMVQVVRSLPQVVVGGGQLLQRRDNYAKDNWK